MSDVVDKLTQDHLLCQICQGVYKHPKALPCLHSFCCDCLEDYVFSRFRDDTEQFPCPLCRYAVIIPEGGVRKFPDNHLLNSLIDTINSKTTESEELHTTSDITLQSVRSNNPVQNNVYKADVIFGQYGDKHSQFVQPKGICFSLDSFGGRYLNIVDQHEKRILSFYLTGRLKCIFKSHCNVSGIASTGGDKLYVSIADGNTSSLAVCYSLQGNIVQSIGSFFAYEFALCIGVSPQGHKIVVLVQSSFIGYIFNNDGKFLHKFGKRGRAKDAFMSPHAIVVSLCGDIFISDTEAHCIKVFDHLGHFKHTIGSPGVSPGQLFRPKGIALDNSGNLVIVDAGNFRIQKFSSDGTFVDIIIDKLNRHSLPPNVQPSYIAIDQDKIAILYIGERFAQVRIYSYECDAVACRKPGCFCQ